MSKRIVALFAAMMMAVGVLAGCGGGGETPAPDSSPSPTVSPTPSQEPTPTPDVTPEVEKAKVNVAMLKGPTGMGAAKLMSDSEAGNTINDYTFTVYTENPEVTTALAQGDVDIAALATNVAANFYGKTNGGIQIIALNTYGVLKILQSGEGADIDDLDDLKGKTIYATGQGANPEYVLNYLLMEEEMDPASDVDIRWMTAEEVTQGLLSGNAEFAMLPVPAATAAQIKSEGKVRQVLDLTEEWDDATDDSELTMGCVVVRTEFAKENPGAVRDFLKEYEASIAYMADPANLAVSSDLNPGQLLEKYGIVAAAAIGAKALPQANLTFVSGVKEIRNTIQGYYEVLFEANPAAIGGGIPDDAFYFE